MLDGEGISLNEHSLWPQAKVFIDNQLLSSRVWPVVSMIYSIGMHFLLLLFTGVLVGVKKRWKYLLPLGPVLALWIGCMFSPVHAELRYALGLFVIAPLLALLAVQLRCGNSNSEPRLATQQNQNASMADAAEKTESDTENSSISMKSVSVG